MYIVDIKQMKLYLWIFVCLTCTSGATWGMLIHMLVELSLKSCDTETQSPPITNEKSYMLHQLTHLLETFSLLSIVMYDCT